MGRQLPGARTSSVSQPGERKTSLKAAFIIKFHDNVCVYSVTYELISMETSR